MRNTIISNIINKNIIMTNITKKKITHSTLKSNNKAYYVQHNLFSLVTIIYNLKFDKFLGIMLGELQQCPTTENTYKLI